jgi:hypothetical protein
MSSIIELEEPFKSLYRKGYLQLFPNGRKYIHLYNSDKDRTLISYARYMLSVKYGYLVSDDVDADHKDNDFTNDNIDNIQSLSKVENIRKHHISSKGFILSDTDQYCVICNKPFRSFKIKDTCGEDSCKKQNRRNISLTLGLKPPEPISNITEDIRNKIRNLSNKNISDRQIAINLGISRSSVAKYKKL